MKKAIAFLVSLAMIIALLVSKKEWTVSTDHYTPMA